MYCFPTRTNSHASSVALALVVSVGAASSGCGDDAATGAGSTGAGGSAPNETCTATFTWLQKDAYKSTAGRSSALWPPHTTTTLGVTCSNDSGENLQLVASEFMANHGTEPGAVDENGDVILVDMRHESATGSRAELLELVEQFKACECDPDTKFLSLDSLGDAAVQELVTNVVTYLQTHLTCSSPGGVDALIGNLQAGDIDLVLADLPSCTWDTGDFSDGLDEALTTLLATTQELLAGYHVCNNDAVLQATLWSTFVDGGTVVACDGSTDVCKGPLWLYDP